MALVDKSFFVFGLNKEAAFCLLLEMKMMMIPESSCASTTWDAARGPVLQLFLCPSCQRLAREMTGWQVGSVGRRGWQPVGRELEQARTSCAGWVACGHWAKSNRKKEMISFESSMSEIKRLRSEIHHLDRTLNYFLFEQAVFAEADVWSHVQSALWQVE